jgi:4-hydroxybenzoate polyprenyltransferase
MDNNAFLQGLQRRFPRVSQRAPDFWRLTRMDRPIGIYLLLWPTLWCLWIAGEGTPSWKNILIFVLGTVLMRAAGCCINDFADRNFDGKVKRTSERPLPTGRVTAREALACFVVLCLVSFVLVLFTNPLTIAMSVPAVLLAACYPFMKRHTHMAQTVLGAAFSWGGMMAFTAETGTLPLHAWLLYVANLLWTVVYDTEYAMVDRDDDLKLGLKSTAILFAEADRIIIGFLQAGFLFTLWVCAQRFGLGGWFLCGLLVAAALFVYQQVLIRKRERERCFQAFLNNNMVGLVIFVATAMDLFVP